MSAGKPGIRRTGRSSQLSTRERVSRRFLAGEQPGNGDELTSPQSHRLEALVAEESPLMPAGDRERLVKELHDELLGLGRVAALLEDPDVTDVLVNGPGQVWVERNGELLPTGLELDRAEILRAIERLVAPLGLRCDRAHPIAHGRLDDGTRVTAVLDPVAVGGPALALRKHSASLLPVEAFAECATTVDRLRELVASRANLVVFGATGSGKTTLVNSLASLVPHQERIVVIEETAELTIEGPQTLQLESQATGSTGAEGGIDQRELVRAALRLRPDRLVVGEVRGPEAVDMIWALSSGHAGSMSTCHAHSAEGAVSRLTTMSILGTGEALGAEVLRRQVLSAVDCFIGVARGRDGSRRVASITTCSPSGLAATSLVGS